MDVPWLSIKESCDYQCHINAHNSDLGDDFPMIVGTPIPAPVAGTLSNFTRSEPAPYKTLYLSYFQPDGSSDLFEFMHWSRFAAAGHYEEGQTIGWSGGALHALGSGKATGPHLHANAVIGGKLAPVRQLISGISRAGTGPVTPALPPRTKGQIMSELYGAIAPSPVPQKYLDINSGLKPGLSTYMLVVPGLTPRLTQDQTAVVPQWINQQFGLTAPAGIVGASWGWFDQLFDDAVANTNSKGGSAVGGSAVPTPEDNALAVVTALAPAFSAIPTAEENGDASRSAIVK